MEIFIYIATYVSKKIVNLSINFNYIHMVTWKLIHRNKGLHMYFMYRFFFSRCDLCFNGTTNQRNILIFDVPSKVYPKSQSVSENTLYIQCK